MLVKILNIFRPSPNSLPRLRFTPGKFSSQNRFLPDLPSAIGLRLSIPDKIQSIGPVHPSRYLRPGNILRENHELPAPDRKKGKSWADFIAARKDVLVGCDFFTKEVWTLGGLVTYYVLFFMHVATRKVYIAGFTKNPNEQWMKQIARNVTMNAVGFLDGMKYLICDRDGKFAPTFRNLIESAGIEILRLPAQKPQPQRLRGKIRAVDQGRVPRPVDPLRRSLVAAGTRSVHRAFSPRAPASGEGKCHPFSGQNDNYRFRSSARRAGSMQAAPRRPAEVLSPRRGVNTINNFDNPTSPRRQSTRGSGTFVQIVKEQTTFLTSIVRNLSGVREAQPINLTIRGTVPHRSNYLTKRHLRSSQCESRVSKYNTSASNGTKIIKNDTPVAFEIKRAQKNVSKRMVDQKISSKTFI